jgi:hypothetical protein
MKQSINEPTIHTEQKVSKHGRKEGRNEPTNTYAYYYICSLFYDAFSANKIIQRRLKWW